MTILAVLLTLASLHVQYRVYLSSRAPKSTGSHRTEGLFVSS